MAEAFAASGLAALEILKSGKVARSAGPMNLPVFRRFAAKLAEANPEARAWLEMEVLRHPTDPDLRLAMRKSTEEDGVHVTAAQLAIDYLGSGNRKLFNILRFWNTPEVLAFLEVHLSRTVDDTEVGRALEILKGYETRMRGPVVKVVLANWSRLSAYDFGTTVQVLTAYDVPESSRSRVVDFLNAELAGPNESVARKGLERLLR